VTKLNEVIAKLRKAGFDLGEVIDMTKHLGASEEIVREIYSVPEEKSLTREIDSYIETTQGYFSKEDCDRELKIVSKQGKNNRRQILHRRVKDGILEKHPSKDGLFRRIQRDSAPIEWEEADISNVFPIRWPFEIENYALMYPKNIAVLAGESNVGKTAFLLEVTRLNMAKHTIHYFSSEMGAEELKLRISKFEDNGKWVFDPRERSTNFADVIYPDDVNIIDYFEFATSEFFRLAEELRAIFDKLRTGIAIIALQKKKGSELGRGAEFGLEKPRLYLSMEFGKLKIIKAKNWAVEGQNPNGMEFHFSLVNGAKFIGG